LQQSINTAKIIHNISFIYALISSFDSDRGLGNLKFKTQRSNKDKISAIARVSRPTFHHMNSLGTKLSKEEAT